jgi:hypothetical protein
VKTEHLEQSEPADRSGRRAAGKGVRGIEDELQAPPVGDRPQRLHIAHLTP